MRYRWLLILLAFDIGLRASMAAGVPGWRDWPPGDAHDVAVVCALVVYFVTHRRQSAAQGDVGSSNPTKEG